MVVQIPGPYTRGSSPRRYQTIHPDLPPELTQLAPSQPAARIFDPHSCSGFPIRVEDLLDCAKVPQPDPAVHIDTWLAL